MEPWRERWTALRERWNALSARARIGAMAGVGVLVAAAVLFYAHGANPTQAILFSNLSQQDAASIVERLRAMNVAYELEAGGGTILVAESAVHETRLTLANEGLPNGGGVGFEIFDTARFGESDFSEQVQFRRALEGELGRTIGHIAGVQSARVHLVLPERTLFASEERTATASVALHLSPGWRLREEQVEGVAHLVASSVPGLTPERVTVVDGDGRSLHSTSEAGAESASDAEELRAQIERSKQRAVQQLLDASLGPGVAVVRVSADVNMSREEQLDESYDPQRTATRSLELTEERDPTAEGGGSGIPGAASNLPGGAEVGGGSSTVGLARRSERRNFEVTKTVRRAVHPVGRLARLTVAVVVDGTWEGEGDARAFTPREEEELTRIRSLVSTAAGLNETRGDEVIVECVPFAGSAEAPVELVVDPLAPYLPYAPYAAGAVLLLVLLIAFAVWRRKAKAEAARLAEERKAAALAAGEDYQELEAPRSVDAAPELDPPAATKALADYEQMRALALEVARRDPELAARVVRGWLAEDVEESANKEAA